MDGDVYIDSDSILTLGDERTTKVSATSDGEVVWQCKVLSDSNDAYVVRGPSVAYGAVSRGSDRLSNPVLLNVLGALQGLYRDILFSPVSKEETVGNLLFALYTLADYSGFLRLPYASANIVYSYPVRPDGVSERYLGPMYSRLGSLFSLGPDGDSEFWGGYSGVEARNRYLGTFDEAACDICERTEVRLCTTT